MASLKCRSWWAGARAESHRLGHPSGCRRGARAEVATDTSAGRPRAQPAGAAACPRSDAPGGRTQARSSDPRSSRRWTARIQPRLWSWTDTTDGGRPRRAHGPPSDVGCASDGHGRCARQAGRHLGHGRARGLRRRHLRSSGHAFVLLPQLLERLRQARALAELAAFGSCGVEFLGRDGLIALDAELRAERAWLRDRFLNPLLGHAYLPFLTGTPRFLSRALSRAEPSLMPARLSAALSLASVHFGLPRAVAIAIFAAVPRVRLLRGWALVEHGRVVFVREHVALELVAQARVVGLRLGPRAGERVRAVLNLSRYARGVFSPTRESARVAANDRARDTTGVGALRCPINLPNARGNRTRACCRPVPLAGLSAGSHRAACVGPATVTGAVAGH